MSTDTTPDVQSQRPMTVKEAKAAAKAAKAYATVGRPWYRKKRVLLPVAVVVLIAVIKSTSGSESSSVAPSGTGATKSAPAPVAAKPAAGIGTPVRDGKFEFTVTRIEHPGKTVGSDFAKETAQGEFVIVYVNVKNIGNEAQTLDSSSQELVDSKGRNFKPSTAIFSLPEADKAFLENINPGNAVTDAPILFDVPAGTVLSTIKLHDSLLSGGKTVKLS